MELQHWENGIYLVFLIVTADTNGLMSSGMFTKLNGIEAQANKYVLPAAATDSIGGVKKSTTIANLTAESTLESVINKVNLILLNLRSIGLVTS